MSPGDGGWLPVAPSALPFDAGYPTPKELSVAEIKGIVKQFADGARRALEAGFEIVETLERDPYPDVEHQGRRAYVLATKPGSQGGTS